jgi:hypothetical protein
VTSHPTSPLAQLPSVDAVLRLVDAAPALAEHGRTRLRRAVRGELDRARDRVRDGAPAPSPARILAAAVTQLGAEALGRTRRVVNATGVVIHTNLGRAPLSAQARRAIVDAAGYATVEYRTETGERDTRTAYPGSLAAELCGAEAATVVNNGAAALLLVLTALGFGREVIVSRGELIEIGGSFRLPDVMAVSGVTLVEVGTTNRTRPGDYRDALGPDTALLLKAHRSNFRQIGFTREVSTVELVEVGRAADIPVVYDIGSGLIHDVEEPGPLATLAEEPSARRAVAEGADLSSSRPTSSSAAPRPASSPAARIWSGPASGIPSPGHCASTSSNAPPSRRRCSLTCARRSPPTSRPSPCSGRTRPSSSAALTHWPVGSEPSSAATSPPQPRQPRCARSRSRAWSEAAHCPGAHSPPGAW